MCSIINMFTLSVEKINATISKSKNNSLRIMPFVKLLAEMESSAKIQFLIPLPPIVTTCPI
jgi:hypothetical protein